MFQEFLNEIQANKRVKIIDQMDMISIITIDVSKNVMEEIMQNNKAIKYVEKDGKVFTC